MQHEHAGSFPPPSGLRGWDAAGPDWWFTTTHDDTEVHLQAAPELGWAVFSLREGVLLGPVDCDPDQAVAVRCALERVAAQARLLH